ncbi:hypothetical protein NP493_1435g01000 [Ridgeia piscesae]|uniref:Uncharacterized protein n=1 Tax=Ridgeia piscesae TaxID=27915 RepID=A0AAD9K2Z0_RIDPI|nr:hypothetical protein NP493_1435g01000 [Ridgeia piscesae]
MNQIMVALLAATFAAVVYSVPTNLKGKV